VENSKHPAMRARVSEAFAEGVPVEVHVVELGNGIAVVLGRAFHDDVSVGLWRRWGGGLG